MWYHVPSRYTHTHHACSTSVSNVSHDRYTLIEKRTIHLNSLSVLCLDSEKYWWPFQLRCRFSPGYKTAREGSIVEYFTFFIWKRQAKISRSWAHFILNLAERKWQTWVVYRFSSTGKKSSSIMPSLIGLFFGTCETVSRTNHLHFPIICLSLADI